MTSLYPATSAKSRAGIASAIQGSRPACQSRRAPASIISGSGSGSAILPKLDSTRQRRASQPSIWSVTAATPKTIAAGQLCPPSALSSRTTKTGISASRTIVSALGICATGAGTARVATLEGYGGDGSIPFRRVSFDLAAQGAALAAAAAARAPLGARRLPQGGADAGGDRGLAVPTGPRRPLPARARSVRFRLDARDRLVQGPGHRRPGAGHP